MAYSGIYIAFDGLTREDASPWSSTAVLSDLEKKTINKNIYELLSITKNDLNDDGEVFGGLSIKTKPNTTDMSGKTISKPGNTIMYVSSDGLLHISGIMLGSKLLHVEKDEDDNEKLYWGENILI